MTKDPVCMNVEEKTAASVIYDGKTYNVCSAACTASFETVPGRFTAK